jgi:hypothetical protein
VALAKKKVVNLLPFVADVKVNTAFTLTVGVIPAAYRFGDNFVV